MRSPIGQMGVSKENLIEVFLREHAQQQPVLVATQREDTYEIWIRPLRRNISTIVEIGPPPNASWAG